MRHSIPYYIREHLREQRSVAIPGLGTFYLSHQSAQISNDKSSIYPPKISLGFDELAGDELPLLKRIVKVENMDLAKVKKKLSKYTESIFNVLINLNKVEIEGIGTLVRSEDEEIRFVDTVELLTDEYQGLKEIPLVPVKRLAMSAADDGQIFDEQIPITTEQEFGEEQKPNRPWWIPILGGIILALAYVLTMQTCEARQQGKEATDPVEETLGAVLEDDAELDVSPEAQQDEDVVQDGDLTATTDSETVGASTLDDERGNFESEDSETSVSDNVDAIRNEGNQRSVSDDPIDDTPEIDYALPEVANGTSPIKSVAYDDTTCIVIVGSFTKPKNALKMMDKVQALGYEVYTSAYDRYTRVGLKFNCKQADLPIYLSEVQSKIERQAWYLDAPGM